MAKPTENQSNPAEHGQQVTYDNPQGCLLRLFWMAIANLGLLILILSISSQDGVTLLDGLYWVIVAAGVSARYIDITRFNGLTVEGSPAKMTDFRRYAVRWCLVALGLWIGTHLLQRVV